MNPDAIAAYLADQRWFAGKGRDWRLAGTSTVGWLSRGSPAVRIALAAVAYADGDSEVYQLPLVHYDEPVDQLRHAFLGEDADGSGVLGRHTWVYDALHVKEVTGLWLQGIAEEAVLGDLRFRLDPSAKAIPLDAPSIVIGAEQSNTSLIFGDVAILKVFRRLSAGLNPDIELHAALARAESRHIAAPLGWVEATWDDPFAAAPAGGGGTGTSSTGQRVEGSLAMLQEFLRNGVDGWELARTSVRDLLAERDLHAEEVGGDFAAEAYRLGTATAEVHGDLARTLPTGMADPARLAEQAGEMRARLGRAAGDVPELRPYVDDLRATYDALPALDEAVPVQRIHGDYHLGQVMRTPQGWKLLDFEGEPAKSLPERRALDSPLRDVAGMLRSFDYAARHLLTDGPWDPQRNYRAVEWAERNRTAFCEGYAEGGGMDPHKYDVLLRAYETDKAVYEVVYEARNRPSWLRIPLAAVERLAEASQRRNS